jgi:hypothetical protein
MAIPQKVYSGNTIVVMINNKPVGLLQNLTASEDYSPEAASGVGNPSVIEYVPTMQRINLACDSMSLKKDSLFSVGVFPGDVQSYLASNPFIVQIIDKVSGQTIRQYENCIFASGTVSIRKHTIVAHNCSLLSTTVTAGTAPGFQPATA